LEARSATRDPVGRWSGSSTRPRKGVRTVAPGAIVAEGIGIGDYVREAHGRQKGVVETADFAQIRDAEVDVVVKHEHFPDLPLD
jgi:hypothetical protein